MRHYRLYFLNAADHIERYETIEAAGDDDAIERATSRTGRQKMELWQRARMIRTFKGNN